jgi:thymidylate synthase
MLQEILARDLSVELGTYKHAVGSLHLYDRSVESARHFLDEGWQPTEATMPPMPVGDPWPGVAGLLEAESSIRTSGGPDNLRMQEADPYWADLIRLLQVFRCKKYEKDLGRIKELRGNMSSGVYFPFIDKVLRKLG